MKKILALIVLVMFFVGACAPKKIIETVIVETTRIVEIEKPIEIELTRIVEVPIEITRIVEVTPLPPPMPQEFLSLEGLGNSISENFEWGKCQKAVFIWSAMGRDNMIVYLYKIGIDDRRLLVNEIGPGTGQALQSLLGGTYFLEISGPSQGWTIIGECQD